MIWCGPDHVFLSCDVCRLRFGEATGDASPAPDQPLVVSHQSVNSHLGRQEESESFLASLVDTHFQVSEYNVPLVKWRTLRALFEQAGRRPQQLDPSVEPFIRCVFAYGALTSDSPYLIGADAPRFSELDQCRGQNLAVYGHRRRQVAQRLLDQAAASIDKRGLWRDSSGHSVSVMMVGAPRPFVTLRRADDERRYKFSSSR